MSKIRIISTLLLSLALCACEPPWQPLDIAKKGDLLASPSDFVIYSDTVISYRRSYSPSTVSLMPSQYMKKIGVQSAEEYSQFRSNKYVIWLQDKHEYLGTPSGIRFTSQKNVNNSRNISITVNFDLEGNPLNHGVIVTARQNGNYFQKRFQYNKNIICNTINYATLYQRVRDSISCQSDRAVVNFLKELFKNTA